jgi:hypothetical protein
MPFFPRNALLWNYEIIKHIFLTLQSALTAANNDQPTNITYCVKVKVKQSLYMPWRRLGGEEV